MEPERKSDPRLRPALALILWIVTVLLYLPTAGYDFISFDDPLFVTDNPHVNQGLTWDGVIWAFTKAEIDYWRPLCWLSHMVDVEFYGLEPGGHHVTSLVIHAFSSVLLFFFFITALNNTPAAFLIAALFAWHPLHVESVAWIAERKDVLCGLFWHAALLVYARYARSEKPLWLFTTLGFFFLGLMSKPMIVTLPCQLLLLDYWPFDRARDNPRKWGRLVAEKIPFFALAAACSAFTFQSQVSVGEMAASATPPFDLRLGNAIVAYGGYLQNTFWPAGLGLFYPFPSRIPTEQLAAAGMALFGVTYVAAINLKARPFLLTGWFWFLGTLVPVVGLLKVGGQASADRYTYMATTGLFWGIALLAFPAGLSTETRRLRTGLGVVLAVVLLWTCRLQIHHWRNNITLFTHTLSVTKDNWVMLNNLARSYLTVGDLESARRVYEEIVALKPHHFAHYFLGKIYATSGRSDLAEYNFTRALELEPTFHLAAFDLGELRLAKNDPSGAAMFFERTLRGDPDHEGAKARLEELGR